MIPNFDSRGLLPQGIHHATLNEIEQKLGYTARRAELIKLFRKMISTELLPHGAGLYVDIDGSFVTDKPNPDDIDATVRVPISLLTSASPIMQNLGDNAGHARVKNMYLVDFYFSLEGLGNDFSSFFQYVGDKTGALKQLPSTELKGILRIQL